MARVDGSARVWLTGLCLSATVHAGLAAGAIWASAAGWMEADRARRVADAAEATPPERPPPLPPEAEREITLGRSESTRTTLAWLGFVEPTEHTAPLGLTDQSAMTINAAGSAEASPGVRSPEPEVQAESETAPDGAPDAEPLRAVAEQTPPPIAAAMPPTPFERSTVESQPVPDAPSTAEAAVRAVESAQSTEPTPARDREREGGVAEAGAMAEAMGPPVPSAAELAAAQEQEAQRRSRQVEIEAAERALRESAARDAASESRAAGARPRRPQVRGAGGLPGLASDRESIATAIRSAPIVRPGQVVASRGLDVRTVAPRWSMTAQLTLRPRNPTVYVTFGRDGRVREAGFVRDGEVVLDAGREEINEPLLNAVYNWTARGRALEELDPADPSAEVTLLFTIVLVR